jgi:hypothetical protein
MNFGEIGRHDGFPETRNAQIPGSVAVGNEYFHTGYATASASISTTK